MGRGGGRKERVRGPRRSLREVLRSNVWVDGISYGASGLRAAVEMCGRERVLWGSDHPFFPPVGISQDQEDDVEGGEWESVRSNVEAVREVFKGDEEGMRGVLGENAVRLLGLDVPRGEEGGG